MKSLAQKVLAEARHKFFAAIMMMNTTGEPNALQIDLKSTEFLRTTDTHVGIDGLKRLTNAQIKTSELVESDVAAKERGLREIINELFLSQRQLLEAFQAVAEQLDVSKALVTIGENDVHDGSFFLCFRSVACCFLYSLGVMPLSL